MSIFKACDVRGTYGVDLTPDVALGFGRAVGTVLSGQRLVLGSDVRPSSGPLKAAVVEGMIRSGCQVLDLGTVPTPAFYFAHRRLAAAGGVMVTGSHNPAPDNGFKVILRDLPVTEGDLAGIESRMVAGAFLERPGGSVTPVDMMGEYERDIVHMLPQAGGRSLRVVVDSGNGCYSECAPRVLRRAGHEVVELFCEPDGTFPSRPPNPAVGANLGALASRVVETGADLGVAYDGDGDRAVFVDGNGHIVESDRSIVLLARYLLAANAAAGHPLSPEVIYDIKCSSAVAEGVVAAGGKPVVERSGHAYIKSALLRRRAVFGGEISGHFFFGSLGRDDGLYATLLMLKVLQSSGCTLSALADSVPRYATTPDLRLPCPAERAADIIAAAELAFRSEPGCEVSTLDGCRISWGDGWALVRASVTEPLLTLRFEARDAGRLAAIQRTVGERVPEVGRLMGMSPTGRGV